MVYTIASADEYLAITGAGIRRVRIVKSAWVWPWQRCQRFSIQPHDYAMNLQAMVFFPRRNQHVVMAQHNNGKGQNSQVPSLTFPVMSCHPRDGTQKLPIRKGRKEAMVARGRKPWQRGYQFLLVHFSHVDTTTTTTTTTTATTTTTKPSFSHLPRLVQLLLPPLV